ncbi:hypothetical protein KUTeg_017158 [Tegillarca granosa]|uniref:40S ribosomal protein S7 n=1 Tax=Tegillarca granosa TaxID=220873 RepID=A0ABQ9ETI3_TEGGR|nr:hypothetical protein KUTeg_017158 [Tegillarca granosa]
MQWIVYTKLDITQKGLIYLYEYLGIGSAYDAPLIRTLTAVHDSILDDLTFPAEIVGKRIRVKLDGSRLIKVHLDKTQQTNIEHKLDTFTAVYKKLTGKDVNFEFPEAVL